MPQVCPTIVRLLDKILVHNRNPTGQNPEYWTASKIVFLSVYWDFDAIVHVNRRMSTAKHYREIMTTEVNIE